jgi:hypothetical protein
VRSFSAIISEWYSTFLRSDVSSSWAPRRFSDSIRMASSFSRSVSFMASRRCAFCPCVLYTVASSSRRDEICDSKDAMYAARTGFLAAVVRKAERIVSPYSLFRGPRYVDGGRARIRSYGSDCAKERRIALLQQLSLLCQSSI